MSDTFEVGDRVTWQINGKSPHGYVVAVTNDGRYYRVAFPFGAYWLFVKQLTRLPSLAASADAPAPSFAALTDDYAETMLRFAGAIESGVVEA